MSVYEGKLTTGDLNFLWAYAFADAVSQCGVNTAVISPGSRSTPLTFAFHYHPDITCHSVIDERAAAFFALGMGKATGKPVVLVCTSGTAGTNYFPAITEARASGTPMIVATADRPASLQNTGSNQTINQRDLFGDKVACFYDAGLPAESEIHRLQQQTARLYKKSAGSPGPVHCNFPFQKPLEPVDPDAIQPILSYYAHHYRFNPPHESAPIHSHRDIKYLLNALEKAERGIIFAGPLQYDADILKVIHLLNSVSGFPVVADGLSQLRSDSVDNIDVLHFASNYMRAGKLRESVDPDLIIRFGELPISNGLIQFLTEYTDTPQILIQDSDKIHHIGYSLSKVISTDYHSLYQAIKDYSLINTLNELSFPQLITAESESARITAEYFNQNIHLSEPMLYYLLKDILPQSLDIFLSNSMPVRDYDSFALPIREDHRLYFNRGVSGIDGIISSATGVASAGDRPLLLITGDLAFYHDLNSLAYLSKLDTPFIILLIDNSGGGIFEMLPVSRFQEPYEKYIRTPLHLDFGAIITSFGITYSNPETTHEYRTQMQNAFRAGKPHVVHVITDAKKSMQVRQDIWKTIQEQVEKIL